MKIFVVNLKKHTERLDRMLCQFEKFNITNFEIVEAVNGKELSHDQLRTCYDPKTAKRIVRELTPGEIGCALSHVEVCRRIIKENKRCLVLEDDVILSDTFKNFVDLEIEDPCDVMFFGAGGSNYEHENLPKSYPYKNIRFSTNVYGRTARCYLDESYSIHGGVKFYDIDKQSNTVDFLSGTYAYAPSIAACHKIIKINYPVKAPADYVWNYLEFDLSFKIAKQNIIDVDSSIKSEICSERKEIDISKYSKLFLNRINQPMFNK
jgi:glycosyl transferase family 25